MTNEQFIKGKLNPVNWLMAINDLILKNENTYQLSVFLFMSIAIVILIIFGFR